MELRPDLDQVEALTSEREALWARIEKVSFLTLNEKRQAVGYAPLEEAEAPAGQDGVPVVFGKYNPNQPRAPRGTSEGGQWVGSGGGLGSIARGDRVPSQGETDAPVRLAQAEDASGIRVDLHEHKKRGGHTIDEHVGKTDAYLLARVRGDRGPALIRKRAGSYPSLEAATKLTNSTLAKNRERVERVARGEVLRDFVTAEFESKTGREAFAPSEYAEPYLRDTYGVGVSIIHDPTSKDGYTIISSYPRNPE